VALWLLLLFLLAGYIRRPVRRYVPGSSGSEEGGDRMFLRLYTGVSTWWTDLKGRVTDEGGATAVEYALMVALIAVVIIAAVAFIGKAASTQFNYVGGQVNNPS
jgi:pilus assembly protein Flp/PilA